MQDLIIIRFFSRGLGRRLVVLAGTIFPLLTYAATSSTFGEMDAEAFANAQTSTYTFQYFSDQYRATLEISDQADVFRPGIISVYDRNSSVALIKVKSDELVLDTHPLSVSVCREPY